MNTKDDKSKDIHVKTHHSQTWKLKTKMNLKSSKRENNTLSIEREREKERKTHTHTIRIAPNISPEFTEISEVNNIFQVLKEKEPSTQNPISSESIPSEIKEKSRHS